MIELAHISKSYQLGDQTLPVLHDTNLSIADGELVALVGASGSGKTTTMNIIGLLDNPSSGHYYLNGQEVSNLHGDLAARLRNETMGFVFQQFLLLPRLNAVQNVGLPLTYRRMKADEIHRLAMQALEKVGIADLYDHRPNQLSGGQQQRVAIARAIVTEPKILLADEPTGSLDSKTGQSIMNLLLEINEQVKTTVILVTHDHFVADHCRRSVRLADGHVVSDTRK